MLIDRALIADDDGSVQMGFQLLEKTEEKERTQFYKCSGRMTKSITDIIFPVKGAIVGPSYMSK